MHSRYRIYLVPFGYYSTYTFSGIREAIEYAKNQKVTARVEVNNYIMATVCPVGGITYNVEFE